MEGSQTQDEVDDLSAVASTSYAAAKSGSMKNTFNVDSKLIQSVPMSQQACELQELGLTVFNQDDFEQGVMAQVDQALAEAEEKRMRQMLERELNGVLDDRKSTEQELQHIDKVMSMLTSVTELNKDAKRKLISVKKQKEYKFNQMKKLKAREKSLLAKLQVREEPVYKANSGPGAESGASSAALNHALGFSSPHETDMERRIRLGEMTPFGTVIDDTTSTESKLQPSDVDRYLINQEKLRLKKKGSSKSSRKGTSKLNVPASRKLEHSDRTTFLKKNKVKHANDLHDEKGRDGNLFDAMDKRVYRPAEKDFSNIRCNKRKLYPTFSHPFSGDGELSDQDAGDMDAAADDYYNDEDYTPDSADDADDIRVSPIKKRKGEPKLSKRSFYENSSKEFDRSPGKKTKLKKNSTTFHRDDGNLGYYRDRIRSWYAEKDERRQECLKKGEILSDDESDLEFENGFKVPPKIWKKLFKYQKTAVRWLWELHSQQVGGIIGDEMGLGKTIQMIAFMVALKTTRNRNKGTNAKYIGLGPSLIVCPATVMHQWVKEFHTWAPQFRVAVLHGSGSYSCTEESLVAQIVRSHGVLLTSYSSLVIHQDLLIEHDWHYVILDEGHKIRNPDAQATLVCKQFRTCHRIILSGSPMQNNLKELWSLFDFVFPGKLGTLPDFMQHFSIPIVQGGYATANEVQVKVAYKCASTLRDTINPYLLRRVKANVQNSIQLPSKNEQVLFCRLTDHQKEVYKEYLESKECNQIISGNFTVFPGLITLRTICNHPDLSTGGPKVFDPSERDGTDESLAYGYYKRSGKMLVVESLLKIWKQQQHRVLMFSQSRTMLDILEKFVQGRHYSYVRMDGTTSISSRQPLIAKYNSDPTIFLFLLTTRVGGLGVNLTGADRVVIFDPDWNPSTDMQARERAWRIGQKSQVTVYRLITTGTIEEKIYHRQIFKQFLANRVLKDPKQRRFFKSNDLYELFTLGDDDPENGTETSAIFAGTDSDVKIQPKITVQNYEKKNKFDQMKDRQKKGEVQLPAVDMDDEPEGADDKMSKMRELARKLSKQIAEKSITNIKVVSSKVKNQKKIAKKSKKKRRKKKRDAVFEGETIAYLDRHDTYTPPNDTEDKNAKDDDYVLQKLFKKSGVHSAMQHDTIMMSSDPDFALVESEAARVAEEAVKALRQSRARCLAATSGIPTWTGQSGLSGAPQAPRARFGQKRGTPQLGTSLGDSKAKQQETKSKEDGDHLFSGSLAGRSQTFRGPTKAAPEAPTSSELLAQMRARNHLTTGGRDTEQNTANTAAISVQSKHLDLITDIKNFVSVSSAINGQASTQELLDQFASRVKPSESAEFKAMLQQVCTFRKVEGVGIWRLKSEFR